MKMSKWIAKLIRHKSFLSFDMFILLIYALLVTFYGCCLCFRLQTNLDLRKILGVTNIFLKSRFVSNLKQLRAG